MKPKSKVINVRVPVDVWASIAEKAQKEGDLYVGAWSRRILTREANK